ncbi:hypothetical protein PTKIN_Ptkin11bG0086000 [Pterospermum kingtungense]
MCSTLMDLNLNLKPQLRQVLNRRESLQGHSLRYGNTSQSVLKEFNVYVSRVRGVVRYIRQSPTRLAKFKECVVAEKIENKGILCLNVSTRWNFTYLILDNALKHEKAFETYEELDVMFRTDLILGDGLPKKFD